MKTTPVVAAWRGRKAVEGHRSPRRWRVHGDARIARSVLEYASPLALWAGGEAVDLILVGRRCSVALAQGGAAAPPYRFRVDEFGERFSRVGARGPSGTDRLSGLDRQPGAEGFESRWDSQTERDCVRRTSRSGWRSGGGENISRRGLANVLRLIPLCGTQPRSGEKRWRATAVQDAGAFAVTPGWREASWSAPALWRFGRAVRRWI
jgi:hypothetical protein